MINKTSSLAFADGFIRAELVKDVTNLRVENAIVINLSPSPMVTGDEYPAVVPSWRFTGLKSGGVVSAERVALIKVRRETNLGGVGLRGWDWLRKSKSVSCESAIDCRN